MLWMQPFKRYFEFSGRSSRAEYWQFIGVVLVAFFVGALLDAGSESAATSGIPTLAFIVLIGCVIPIYAVTFRRLHDRGISGWLVGVLWVFNLGTYFFGAIKDSISSSILAAPFVLIQWGLAIIQLGLALWLLSEVVKPGEAGTNEYGPPPVVPVSANMPVDVNARADIPRNAPPSSTHDTLPQLERLADLRRQGALTDAEYEQQKAAILRG